MYLKINNIYNNGKIDYKGLNIDLFVPHSQEYALDKNLCVLETTENIDIANSDVTILSETDYSTQKQQFLDALKAINPIPLEDRLSAVEGAITALMGV